MLDPTDQTATELARLIRDRTYSSLGVVDAYLRRIERTNPELNAIVTLDAERARTAAVAADTALDRGDAVGPLHGVPITVKDGFATAGLRTTFGLPWYRRRLGRYIPPTDAVAVARLRRAGAILLGKTNLPLASYDWQTDHPFLGRTHNPYALDRTAGGSSGGSAAAVAAGLSPLDLASDVAGSIRVPAHFCGVLAMRPTEGRVSTIGMMPPGHPGSLRHALAAGPIARSVADLRLAFQILTGLDAEEPAIPRSLRGIRVAVAPTVGDAPIAHGVQTAWRRFTEALATAGCDVVEASPEVDFAAAQRTWGLVHGFEFASGLPFGLGRAPLHHVFRLGLVRLVFGPGGYSSALARGYAADRTTYFRALAERDRLVQAFDDFMTSWDVWLCPVAGVTAFPHCRTGANLTVDERTVPYSAPIGVLNTGTALAGTPCVTLPIGHDDDGLPIGVQLHARRDDDLRLLGLVESMERLTTAVRRPSTLPLTERRAG